MRLCNDSSVQRSILKHLTSVSWNPVESLKHCKVYSSISLFFSFFLFFLFYHFPPSFWGNLNPVLVFWVFFSSKGPYVSNNLIEEIKAEALQKSALEGQEVSSLAEKDKVGSFTLIIRYSNFCFMAVI